MGMGPFALLPPSLLSLSLCILVFLGTAVTNYYQLVA